MFLLVLGFYSENDGVIISLINILHKRDGRHWKVETTSSTCSSYLAQENAVQKLETLEKNSDVVVV